jgi:hypothetical protein
MGDDCNTLNPKTLLISSLTSPVTFGQMLASHYLPIVTPAIGVIWDVHLNGVKIARVTYISEDKHCSMQPLVAKCELLLDRPNTVYCDYVSGEFYRGSKSLP